MNLVAEQREVERQIDALLAKPKMTASERKTCDALLSKKADIRASIERQERAAVLMKETGADLVPANEEQRAEHRAAKIEGAFARYVRTGDASELRTYVALSTAGVPVPQGFNAAYTERLKSFSGIREVSNIIRTENADPLKSPYSDDTANTGERLNENDPVSLANPTFNDVVFGAFRYASKGLQYSAQLQQDSGIDVSTYLSNIFAKRVGRITNNQFTLGSGGGPAGVIPSITNVQASASPTTVTVSELTDLQNIDAGYLPGAVYMFSPATERALRKMVTTTGAVLFDEMDEQKLLGYPYVLNVDMPSLTATSKAIAFGNFKLGVTIRDVVPMLLISRERFAEFNQLYASLTHSQDCQVTDVNALTILQQHA